jgi:hypothetical protein
MDNIRTVLLQLFRFFELFYRIAHKESYFALIFL